MFKLAALLLLVPVVLVLGAIAWAILAALVSVVGPLGWVLGIVGIVYLIGCAREGIEQGIEKARNK